MTDKEFDKLIKQKLTNIPHDSKSDWETFAKKLKTTPLSDDDLFDKKIAEKVKNHHQKFEPSHWEIMRARLIKEEYVRVRLYLAKCAEVFVLLLFLFGLSETGIIKLNVQSEIDSNLFAHLYHNSETEFVPLDVYPAVKNQNPEPNFATNTEKEKQLICDDYDNQTAFEERSVIIGLIPTIASNKVQSKDVISEGYNQNKNRQIPLRPNMVKPQAIVTLEGKLIIKEKELNIAPVYIYVPEHYVEPTQTKYDISLFNSAGLNLVQSSTDPIYNTAPDLQYGGNYTLGVHVGAGTSKLKVRTGLEVQRRSYKPTQIVETFGSSLNGFSQISLKSISSSLLTIPVMLCAPILTFGNNKTQHISVGIGIGANALLRSSYVIEQGLAEIEIQASNARQTSGNNRALSVEPKLFRKQFDPGLFNGSLLNNFYLDASFDLGYERTISNSNTLIAGVGIKKFLGTSGLGPNGDRFNQVNLKLGILYNLN